jgi:UDP-glucose 4-epimerase
MLKMSTWLVTGGCGFIGSHLVEALLRAGERVRVLDDLSSGKRENLPKTAELIIGNVADADIVADCLEGVAGCFHLAAVASVERSTEDWLGAHRTNLTGTIAIFEKARLARSGVPVPVVYASSAAVYGDQAQMPLNEGAATLPLTPYGADKRAAELHAQVAWSIYGVPNVGLRFFNVYGPRQDASSPYSGVIAIFAERAAKRLPIEIFGDGQQTRDFIYVTDVIENMLAAMANLHSGAAIFNVCTGRATSILELAHAIVRICGSDSEIRHGPARIGDIKDSVGDCTALHRAFGISAATSLADGLQRTLNALLADAAETQG